MKVECTLCTQSEITEWTYTREVTGFSGRDEGVVRSLTLTGELEARGLTEQRLLECSILCIVGSGGAKKKALLELHEAMEEYEVPPFASLEISATEEEFEDFRECLILSTGHANCKVVIHFDIQGLQQDRVERDNPSAWDAADMVERIPGRPLEVTNFYWKFHVT